MTTFLEPPTLASWVDSIDEELTCIEIQQVTHDVRSFVFDRAGRPALDFAPGQYLTVHFDIDGAEHQRCYTITTPPHHSDRLAITVKRVPGGPVSNWLHDRFEVGQRLRVSGPFGGFTMERSASARFLFLSAGSGITPSMAMSRTLRAVGTPIDAVVLHSARTPSDIIFRGELDEMANLPGFSVTTICETASEDDQWAGPTDRISLRTLLAAAPDLHDREIFTCGPPGYMAAVREILAAAEVDPARCHEESFDFGAGGGTNARPAVPGTPPVSPPVGPPSSATETAYAVEFQKSGTTVHCQPGESILIAARRSGLAPASMCAEGFCGTCKVTMLSGEVDMEHAGGIRPKEIAAGKILLCSATPTEDVTLEA